MTFLKTIAITIALGVPLAAQLVFNPNPSRVLGQSSPSGSAINMVEGREVYRPQGVALDTRVNPPMIYVADTFNNRVLGWRNAYNFGNGAPADVVIGQKDFINTSASGPGAGISGGLNFPVGVAVDKNGNLFVVDTGNNRILRFKRPFDQPDVVKTASMVIGQPSLFGRTANAQFANDPNQINPKNMRTNPSNAACGSGCLFASLAFDPSGNLWFTDSGNNRVLRYPAGLISDQADLNTIVDADAVLGQTNYNTNTGATADFAGRTGKLQLRGPGAITVDSDGNIFVADDLARVLVYKGKVNSGQAADRLLGIAQQVQGQPTQAPVNQTGFSLSVLGVFTIGKIPFVVDTGNNRILRYDPIASWPPESLNPPTVNSYSPPASAVIGQNSFFVGAANRIITNEANASSFFLPGAATSAPNGYVFICDAGNNRVLVMPDLSNGPTSAPVGPPYQAMSVLGQDQMYMSAVNLIEGREFNATGTFANGSQSIFGLGTAIDNTSNPPRLYVADTGNNRILGFADARRVKAGDRADLVIGQVDFTRALYNSPNNDPSKPLDTGLSTPTTVAVDANGDLWVSDFGNGRVLRFPKPFAQTGTQRADLVVGQQNFTNTVRDPTRFNMAGPYGIAFTGQGQLLVSDVLLNRVLLFVPPFTSGMAASKVIGQPDFTSSNSGSAPDRLNNPYGIGVDSDDRLYVADAINNRVQFFERPATAPDSGASASFTLSSNFPTSVDISVRTGDIWVSELRGNRAIRYPKFNDLILNPAPNGGVPAFGPISVRLDAADNLLIGDAANRLALHFPALQQLSNAASYFNRLAPGMIATIFLQNAGQAATDTPAVFNGAPWPKALADTAIIVDGKAAPIYYVYPRQIAAQIPKDSPQSGNVEFTVVRVSTGQVIASSLVRMDVASPAFFTRNQQGTQQVAALNQDGTTVNDSATNPTGNPATAPAKPGEVVSFYLTGQGVIPNMPEDGYQPNGLVPTNPGDLFFTINGQQAEVTFSGLAPCCIGLWQINARVPPLTPPLPNIPVALRYRGISSTQNPADGKLIQTWIAVRPQ
jgi:uncharacterized protein (TIGR03437 family)